MHIHSLHFTALKNLNYHFSILLHLEKKEKENLNT